MKTPEKIERPPLFRTAAVLEWLEELTAAVVFIAVVFTFLVRVVTVSGTSMVPNYQDQDRLLVAGCWGGPRQGDVVVLLGVLKEPIIKRVIATAGQTVSFDEEAGVVLVDGQPVDDTQFGLENGCTYLPFGSPDRMEFPRPCRLAAFLCWATTGWCRKTAGFGRWAWWMSGIFWAGRCSGSTQRRAWDR